MRCLPFEELMNKVLELIGLESKLAFMLGQILSIIESRLTIAQENTTNCVVQVVQSEQTLVGIVGVEAGQDGSHELNDVHLGLLSGLVKAVVGG